MRHRERACCSCCAAAADEVVAYSLLSQCLSEMCEQIAKVRRKLQRIGIGHIGRVLSTGAPSACLAHR